jgi:2-haloacid dehalogenase
MHHDERRGPARLHPRAVLFDLLSALLDSDALWNAAAGGVEPGRRWRRHYLALAATAGPYRPYEELVTAAASACDVGPASVRALFDGWDTVRPWPEAGTVLGALRAASLPVGVVTNCSEELGRRAAARLGMPLDVMMTAERAGAYKPDPRPYLRALAELDQPSGATLFVAGSAFDLAGAAGTGMPVVWHNRLALRRPDDAPVPLAELASLTPLPDLVGRPGH